MTAARKTRSRLAVDVRQQQLLDVASEVFAHQPYDEAQIEVIANRAGVSSGLIYHYFPNKKALFAAVVDSAVDDLARMTEPPMDLPPLDQFRHAINGYVDYVCEYEHAYRAMHRGRAAGESKVRDAIERNTRRQVDRIVAVLHPNGPAPFDLELALRGVLASIVETCLHWVNDPRIERSQLSELLFKMSVGAIATAFPDEVTRALDQEPATLVRREGA